MPSKSGYSFDRPRFYALAISAIDGRVFELPGVSTWSWNKRDDGSSGQFSMSIPLQQDYDTIAVSGASSLSEYAKNAIPMDLVALYAARTAVGDYAITPEPLRPSFSGGSLSWGDAGAATVHALGTANCIFIGMVDSIRETGAPGDRAMVSITGRDLTKIFEVNDVGVPDTGKPGNAGGLTPTAGAGSNAAFTLENIEIVQTPSAAGLLLKLLDFLCTKDITILGNGNTPQAATYRDAFRSSNKQTQAIRDIRDTLKGFGFPWRNFVRVDGLDPNYHHVSSASAIPPYNPQAGPVWSTIMEIRNAPLSRLFVNEIGQIIFDDSLVAWTGTNESGTTQSTGTQYGKVAGTIGPEDIRAYEFGVDDSSLLTFFSVLPNNATMALTGINVAKGAYIEGSGYSQGIMIAKNSALPNIKLFGYRYGQFESQFDVGFAEAELRRKCIEVDVNSLFTAQLTLRGRPDYRVGKRYKVALDTSRVETSQKTWYVESISQQGTWGEDWTTTVELKYPQDDAPPTPKARRQASA